MAGKDFIVGRFSVSMPCTWPLILGLGVDGLLSILPCVATVDGGRVKCIIPPMVHQIRLIGESGKDSIGRSIYYQC